MRTTSKKCTKRGLLMSDSIKLFIVEGEERDYRFVKGMTDLFMRGKFEARIIYLPAAQNIYMLYKKLVEDDFQTDIVEVLRESSESAKAILEGISRQRIDEVFMFFDFDIHQKNIKAQEDASPEEILMRMLQTFDNETENGKLYISYPMVEALYDYRENQCQAFYKCLITDDEIGNYKKQSGNNNPRANFHNDIASWEMILYNFGLRIKCLFDKDSVDFRTYREQMTVPNIYLRQVSMRKQYDKTFVLSALPEFLYDYFGENFWHRYWKGMMYHFDSCQREW